MTTNPLDFLEPEGARFRSTANPWVQHLRDTGQTPSFPRAPTAPRLGGGRRQGGVSPAELERLLDPRMTEGLQLAQRQHRSAQDLARAVGVDSEGEPAQGFLNTVFRGIDYPRAVLFNTLRTAFDPNMGPQEFREALDAREGFGALNGIRVEEDDSGLARAWKLPVAFLGDVATDPLMLVSFGALPMGKKLGTQAIQAAVAKRAATLPERVLTKMQRDALEAQARIGAQRSGVTVSKQGEKAAADIVGDMGAPEMAGFMAAEAYQLRGATGLREFLFKYGDEAADLWRGLPGDMRGGLRMRVPFQREEDVRKVLHIAGGGGQFAERIGLRPAVETAHKLRGTVRASMASKAMHKSINGFFGDAYGEMAARLVRQGHENISGVTYAQWQHADKARRGANAVRAGILETGGHTAARVMYTLDNAGSKVEVDEAWKAFNKYASNPEELNRLVPSTGLSADELGNLAREAGNELADMTQAELLGISMAGEYHHLMHTLLVQAQRAGVSIEALNDYLPLVLTKQRRKLLATKKAGLGRRAGRMEHGFDPSRRREMGFEFRAVTDKDGVTRTVLHPLTPKQVNAKVRERARALGDKVDAEPYFEEDLGVVLQMYTGAIAHMASEARFAQILRKSGLVQEGDERLVARLRPRTAGEAQGKIDEALDHLRRLDLGESDGLRKAVQTVMRDAEKQRHTLIRAFDDATLTPEQQVEMAGDVLKAMDTWRDILPSVASTQKTLAKANRAFNQAQTRLRKASRPDVQAGEHSLALQELGLVPVEQAGINLRKLPPDLDMAFAPEVLRDAIHKFYRLQGKEGQDLIDKWYRPYHSMFKMTATIGRGPGFHIRNAFGGTLNNIIYGATPEDAWQMARIVRTMAQTKQQAKKQIAREARGAAREKRGVRHTRGFDRMVAERYHELLEPKLRKMKNVVGDQDGWELYRTLADTPDVLWGRQGRSFEAFGVEETGKAVVSESELYPHLRPEELSFLQRTNEKLKDIGWIRWNTEAAEMTEAYLRGTAFLHGMRKYRDPEIARLGVLVTQFDYQDLSHAERKWLRGTLLPFYTWTRYNVPFQFRALMQNPGHMNRINLAVENARDALGDEDADIMPEWMRTRFGFVSRFEFGGNPLMFGVETPAQDLNEYFKVGSPADVFAGMGRAFGGALNPAFSVPMQMGLQQEFFTGARLDETAGRIAPRWYQALNRISSSAFPVWVDPKTGDTMGDARWIVGAPGGVPWLGQGEKILSILGGAAGLETSYPEGRNRLVSDTIRQFFPVITAGTLSPQSEAGELFQRTSRLRAHARKFGDPGEHAMVLELQNMGLSLEQIAHIMEARRAREQS